MNPDNFFVLSIVSIACGTAIVIVFMAMMFSVFKNRGRGRSMTNEEGEMLQDIWKGLQKMEERITNLETILLHRKKVQDFERKL